MADLMELAERVEALSGGRKRALLAMTDQWQFCGKTTFDANGAHSLYWTKGWGGKGSICEKEDQKDGKWSRCAYRLTPLGIEAQKALRARASNG